MALACRCAVDEPPCVFQFLKHVPAQVIPQCIKDGHIHVGFVEIDWNVLFGERDDVEFLCGNSYEYALLLLIKVGDVVIVRIKRRDIDLVFCIIDSHYFAHPHPQGFRGFFRSIDIQKQS